MKIGHEVILFKNWYNVGILCIHDIIQEEEDGSYIFLIMTEIEEKFNMRNKHLKIYQPDTLNLKTLERDFTNPRRNRG